MKKDWLDRTNVDMLQVAFGSKRPRISEHHHCIFYSGKSAFDTILKTVGKRVGLWGNMHPLIDDQGDAYLPPDDNFPDAFSLAKDYELWSLPENQDYALTVYKGNIDFVMAIDLNTKLSIIQEMYKSPISSREYYEQRSRIDWVADWIGELSWAYIPLGYEAGEYAMFVANDKSLSYKVLCDLQSMGINVFTVFEKYGEKVWGGPIFLDLDRSMRI